MNGYSAVTMETSDPIRERASESRARAARTKRDRTRAALLSAADPAFAARGWARTRVEDIASAAGVSNATAYNHFPTKHALIGHVYAPLLRNLRTQAYRDITAGRPIVPALTDHLRALVRISWRHRGLTAALSAGIADYADQGRPPRRPAATRTTRACSPRSATVARRAHRPRPARRASCGRGRRPRRSARCWWTCCSSGRSAARTTRRSSPPS